MWCLKWLSRLFKKANPKWYWTGRGYSQGCERYAFILLSLCKDNLIDSPSPSILHQIQSHQRSGNGRLSVVVLSRFQWLLSSWRQSQPEELEQSRHIWFGWHADKVGIPQQQAGAWEAWLGMVEAEHSIEASRAPYIRVGGPPSTFHALPSRLTL